MSRELRDACKESLCQALAMVPAQAPTLCEGWSAHDLAVHLWILKHDPLGWPGVVHPRLDAGRTAHWKRRWRYPELVGRLRNDEGGIRAIPFDAREDHRHALGEYFIHDEDVRRANQLPRQHYSTELQEALWLRAQRAGRQLHALGGRSILLQRPDGARAQISGGGQRVRVTGEPTELLLWVYGRHDVAEVEVSSF